LGYVANDLWILKTDRLAVEGMPEKGRERFEKVLAVMDKHRRGASAKPGGRKTPANLDAQGGGLAAEGDLA
jgi:hypothetical protein